MNTAPKRGTLYMVRDGFLICPICGRNHKLLRIDPETRAKHLAVWCKICRREIILDIDECQCRESQSQ